MDFFNENIRKGFFVFGERAALLAVVIVYLLILSFQSSKNVYSKEEEQFVRQTPNFETISDNPQSQSLSTLPVPISVVLATEKITPTPIKSGPALTSIATSKSESSDGDVWSKIAQCESRSNWSIDTGNGYFGGLQFSQGAWNSVGGQGKPSDASKDEQIKRGKMLQEKRGWGVWGDCAKKLGL